MPTQKVFKQRVRARMSKTGESYTTARLQLRRKADGTDPLEPAGSEVQPGPALVPSPDPEPAPSPESPVGARAPRGGAPNLVSETSMIRATGHGHEHWFALLDAWGATGHTHTEIARWVNGTHGVEGWWSQNITVAYERARGLRGTGQMADGFSITVSRTFAAPSDALLAAFTNEAIRGRWLAGETLTQRPTKAALTRRFDWAEPPSRIVVTVVPRDDGRRVLGVSHEQLPDEATRDRLKGFWRERLAALKAVVEG